MPEHNIVNKLDRSPIAILGAPFDNVTLAEVLSLVTGMIGSRQPHYATTVGVKFLTAALEDVELRRILLDAHLILAAEKAVVRAAQTLGNPLPGCVTAADLIPQLLALAEQKSWRVFLLGGAQTDAAVAEKIQARHPQLQLVGVYTPPEKPLLEMDHGDILRRLRAARPDLLLVAFGCPKQEKWINMNYREAGVPFTLGAGATFDFLTGATGKETNPTWGEWGRFQLAVWRQQRQLRHPKKTVPAPVTRAAGALPDAFGNLIVRAPEQLCAAEANLVQAEWLRAVESGLVLCDLADTTFVDSTGVGLLIKLRRRSRELGHQFFLIAPKPAVEAALKLMQLEEFFTVQASVSGARILMESAAHAPVVTSGVLEKELSIRWSGEVTALNAVELGAYTESELTQATTGMTVVIELSRVTFVDSTGIGLMLRFKKNLKRRELNLQFKNPTASVRNVMRHTKLEEYLLGGE